MTENNEKTDRILTLIEGALNIPDLPPEAVAVFMEVDEILDHLTLDQAKTTILRLLSALASFMIQEPSRLLVKRLARPHMSLVVRDYIRRPAAVALLRGVPSIRMQEHALATIDYTLGFTDMGWLNIVNKLLGQLGGDAAIRRYADCFKRFRDPTSKLKFQHQNGRWEEILRHSLWSFGGDEIVLGFAETTPPAVKKIVDDALEAYRSGKSPIPGLAPSADYGLCDLAEVLEAIGSYWNQIPMGNIETFPPTIWTPDSSSVDEALRVDQTERFITFVITALLSVADWRCRIEKMRSRLWELATLQHYSLSNYQSYSGYMLKGATLDEVTTVPGDVHKVVTVIRMAIGFELVTGEATPLADIKTAADVVVDRIVAQRVRELIMKRSISIDALKNHDGADDILELFLVLLATNQLHLFRPLLGLEIPDVITPSSG